MATIKAQNNQRNAANDDWDVIHHETEASIVLMADGSNVESRISNKEILNTTTLTAAGWSGTAPYTQTVTVTGITANRLPDKIIPQYSGTLATAILQRESYCMISNYNTAAGTITFTCLEDKPVTDIPLQIVGV